MKMQQIYFKKCLQKNRAYEINKGETDGIIIKYNKVKGQIDKLQLMIDNYSVMIIKSK